MFIFAPSITCHHLLFAMHTQVLLFSFLLPRPSAFSDWVGFLFLFLSLSSFEPGLLLDFHSSRPLPTPYLPPILPIYSRTFYRGKTHSTFFREFGMDLERHGCLSRNLHSVQSSHFFSLSSFFYYLPPFFTILFRLILVFYYYHDHLGYFAGLHV